MLEKKGNVRRKSGTCSSPLCGIVLPKYVSHLEVLTFYCKNFEKRKFKNKGISLLVLN
jgi:hypothetical protein